MTLRRLALAALCAAALPAAAQDRPAIVVGSPDFRPLPIAVAAFVGEGEARAAAGETAEVVRADLVLSGLFEVLDPKAFLADPAEGFAATSIKFGRWADVGADGLVKARVTREGADLGADLHLYEVRAGREVLSRRIRVPAVDPRRLGHRIADEVIRHYTREPGAFSSQIAVIRKGKGLWELLVCDADGANAKVVLSERSILMAPAWKPDGTEILLTSYRSGVPELWVLRLADRSFRPLGAPKKAMGGVWSPDGSRIAFTLDRSGFNDVWVANADGSGARPVTTDRANTVTPSWSPDGRRIAFASDRAGTPQLFVMDASGGNARRITFQGNYNQTPDWSPRGDAILFTARDERRVFDVFSIDPETSRITRLTQDQGRTNEDPSWAPNGRLVVFRTDRSGTWQLVVSDPRGDRQTVILNARGGELSEPAWGPLSD